MLEQLRNAAKSKFAMILVGALVLSFAIWGIGDIFRGATRTTVAEVGDVAISADDFTREFRTRVQQISRQTNGLIDSEQARRLGLDQQVLARMIARTALDQVAQEMGLALSDQTLARAIQSMEVFKGVTGAFSKDRYREVLASLGMNETFYETSLRRDMIRQQLLDVVMGEPSASRDMVKAIYSHRMEKRIAAYLVIPPQAAGPLPEPDQAALETFHKEHSEDFSEPEYRSFSYLLLNIDAFMERVAIDEQEIRDIYEFDPNRFAIPEKRTVQVIPFLEEQEARQAYEKIKAGASFADIATERGLSIDDITQTDIDQFEIIDPIIGQAAFSLEQDTVSEPINGELGWALVRVISITPGSSQPYEEARKTIRDELAGEEARDTLFSASQALEDELAAGASLEDIATRLNLDLKKVAAVDRSGKTKQGTQPDDLATHPELLQAAFEGEIGMITELRNAGEDSYFTLRVDDIFPAHVKPFDDVKEEVEAAYKAQQLRDKLTEIARSIADRANAGEPFESLAAEFDRSILTTQPPLSRTTTNDTLSAELVAQLFATEPGTYVYSASAFGNSQVVAVTREVIPPDLALEKASVDKLYEQIRQSYVSDLTDQFVGGVQDKLGVRIYPDVIENALGPLPN